jgi:hypothetical protein
MTEKCTGPFSDARDCPVHKPTDARRPQPVEALPSAAETYWRKLADDQDHIFRFTNREVKVLFLEIDTLRAELSALRAERAPTPCPLCSLDDELVQEWLSHARSVAKVKGYDVDAARVPREQRTTEVRAERAPLPLETRNAVEDFDALVAGLQQPGPHDKWSAHVAFIRNRLHAASPADAVQALIAKWREQGKDYKQGDGLLWRTRCEIFKRCADELADALAARPGA